MAGHSSVTLRRHSLANQKPGMHGGAFCSVSATKRKEPCCLVQFSCAEPEQQGHATEQAEPSMQATKLSLSGPSAQFAWFDYSPAYATTLERVIRPTILKRLIPALGLIDLDFDS